MRRLPVLASLVAILTVSQATLRVPAEPAGALRVIALSGFVAAPGANPPAIAVGQVVTPDTVVDLKTDAQLRLATPCGTIVALDGPISGVLAVLLRAAGLQAAACPATSDPRAAMRRKLILSFLTLSPERVLRGGARVAAIDPLVPDIEAASPACFRPGRPLVLTGDREYLGDAIDISSVETGATAPTYFDAGLPGWRWPQDLPLDAGHYVVSTPLHDINVELRSLPPNLLDDGDRLAAALTSAGCLAQGRQLLQRLPADQEIRPSR